MTKGISSITLSTKDKSVTLTKKQWDKVAKNPKEFARKAVAMAQAKAAVNPTEANAMQLATLRRMETDVRTLAAELADCHEEYKAAKARHQEAIDTLLKAVREDPSELLEGDGA